jgi:hypothetical protein
MSEHDETRHDRDRDRNRNDSMADRDREIEQTEEARSASASKLFDIRQVIGGLFTLYGVLVTGAGLLDGDAARKKASGIDINIWTGLGMLALGATMLLWMRLSPHTGAPTGDGDDGPDRGEGRRGA